MGRHSDKYSTLQMQDCLCYAHLRHVDIQNTKSDVVFEIPDNQSENQPTI